MGNAVTYSPSTLNRRTDSRNERKYLGENVHQNQENSRVLFLLYLIHRTWNIVVDSVDHKGKRYI